MQIFVETATNEISIPIEIDLNDQIKEIKNKIQDKNPNQFEIQNFTYNNQDLDDDKQLKDYPIPPNSILIMNLQTKSEIIDLNIQTEDGTILPIKIESNSYIDDLKSLIETKVNVIFDRQKLIYNNQELFELSKLSDYSIKNNSQIKLIIQPIDTLTLFINALSDKLIPLDLKPSDRIEKVKEMIQKVKNIELNRQRLFYNQKELDDAQTIQDYSIPKNSVITLIQKSKNDMKIIIDSFSTGKILAIDVDKDDKIEYIKEKIQFFGGYFIYQQRLTYAGIILEDQLTLDDYLIQKNATIEMALFVKGGNLIFLKTNKGKYFPFEIEPKDSILMLKKEIQKTFDIPFDQLDLFYQNEKLDDYKTFQDYLIQKESIIEMSLNIPENMFICVKQIKSEEVIIDVKQTDKIENVKQKIKELFNINENQQKLIFNGEQLDDNLTLSDYSIITGSEILLIPLINSKFQIFIEMKNNEKISIEVEPFLKIRDIKEKIYEKEKIDVDKQMLFIDDKKLDDDKSIESLPIKKDSILNLLVISKENMTIFVKTNKNKKITFEVQPTDKIEDLKYRIIEKEGFLNDQFNLFIFDKKLEVDKKIEDYDIENGQFIYLAKELNGSMKLFIKYNNERIPIDVEEDFLIEDVKNQVLFKRRIPIKYQKLIFNDKILENDKKVQDYSIENCSLLVLNLQ